MDITTLSIDQLKAIAYDERKRIDVAQQNIAIIERELLRRNQEQPAGDDEKKLSPAVD